MEIRDKQWCRRCGDRQLLSAADERFGMCRSCRLEPIISPNSAVQSQIDVDTQESTQRLLHDINAIDGAGEPAGWEATLICALAAVGWAAIVVVALRWLGAWR